LFVDGATFLVGARRISIRSLVLTAMRWEEFASHQACHAARSGARRKSRYRKDFSVVSNA
jgi:hypothetical protein